MLHQIISESQKLAEFKFKSGTYTGEFIISNDGGKLPHGIGVYKNSNGEVEYEGQWERGLCRYGNFDFKMDFRRGIYIGEFIISENGEKIPHGIGKFIDIFNDTFEGKWRNGKQCGYVENVYSVMRYQGECKNNKKNGWGKLSYTYAPFFYEGNWKNDKKHGYGESLHKSSCGYRGEWKNDKKHGYGILSFMDSGMEIVGSWKEDKLDGYCIFYFQSNKETGIRLPVFKGFFKQDEPVEFEEVMLHNNLKITKQIKDNGTESIFLIDNRQNDTVEYELHIDQAALLAILQIGTHEFPGSITLNKLNEMLFNENKKIQIQETINNQGYAVVSLPDHEFFVTEYNNEFFIIDTGGLYNPQYNQDRIEVSKRNFFDMPIQNCIFSNTTDIAFETDKGTVKIPMPKWTNCHILATSLALEMEKHKASGTLDKFMFKITGYSSIFNYIKPIESSFKKLQKIIAKAKVSVVSSQQENDSAIIKFKIKDILNEKIYIILANGNICEEEQTYKIIQKQKFLSDYDIKEKDSWFNQDFYNQTITDLICKKLKEFDKDNSIIGSDNKQIIFSNEFGFKTLLENIQHYNNIKKALHNCILNTTNELGQECIEFSLYENSETKEKDSLIIHQDGSIERKQVKYNNQELEINYTEYALNLQTSHENELINLIRSRLLRCVYEDDPLMCHLQDQIPRDQYSKINFIQLGCTFEEICKKIGEEKIIKNTQPLLNLSKITHKECRL
jgi:hypothetical protein